jgi:hypothetical protein
MQGTCLINPCQSDSNSGVETWRKPCVARAEKAKEVNDLKVNKRSVRYFGMGGGGGVGTRMKQISEEWIIICLEACCRKV